MAPPVRFSAELRVRAVQAVAAARDDHPSEWSAIRAVAGDLGISVETLRGWARSAGRDPAAPPRAASEHRAELERLRRENAELRKVNEMLEAIVRTGPSPSGASPSGASPSGPSPSGASPSGPSPSGR